MGTTVLECCVDLLREIGLVIEGTESQWLAMLQEVAGLTYERVSAATIYLALVPVEKRAECFSLLGFSPMAHDFSAWARLHGLEQGFARQMSWILNPLCRYYNGPGVFLAMDDVGWGVPCTDLQYLDQVRERLGPYELAGLPVKFVPYPPPKRVVYLEDVLPSGYVESLKLALGDSYGVGTLASDLDALVEKIGGLDTACTSEESVSVFDDLAVGGVDAVVDKSGLSVVCGDYASRVMGNLGCYVSVRDAVCCYAGAVASGQAIGARVVKSIFTVGVCLEPDPGISTIDTFRALVQCWIELSRVQLVPPCRCRAGNLQVSPKGLLSMVDFGNSMGDEVASGFFEFSTGSRVFHHGSGCSLRNVAESSYVVTMGGLRAAVSPAYDRWNHERAGICCSATCECWKSGVIELTDGSWLVAGHFVVSGKYVRGFSQFGCDVLKAGFHYSFRDSGRDWFEYREKHLDAVLDLLKSDHSYGDYRGLACSSACVEMRLLMLASWYHFTEQGDLKVVDVMRSVGYRRRVVEVDGDQNFPVGKVGRVRLPYKCSCGTRHYVER